MAAKRFAPIYWNRVWDYLYACYEALHTTGTNYIIQDIDLYIDARKPAIP